MGRAHLNCVQSCELKQIMPCRQGQIRSSTRLTLWCAKDALFLRGTPKLFLKYLDKPRIVPIANFTCHFA